MRPRRLHELGEELVGWEATLPGESLPENTLHSVKRVIGRQYADVHDLLGVLPFTFQPGPDDSVVLTYEKSSSGETASRHIHTITPEEVGALHRQRISHTFYISCSMIPRLIPPPLPWLQPYNTIHTPTLHLSHIWHHGPHSRCLQKCCPRCCSGRRLRAKAPLNPP